MDHIRSPYVGRRDLQRVVAGRVSFTSLAEKVSLKEIEGRKVRGRVINTITESWENASIEDFRELRGRNSQNAKIATSLVPWLIFGLNHNIASRRSTKTVLYIFQWWNCCCTLSYYQTMWRPTPLNANLWLKLSGFESQQWIWCEKRTRRNRSLWCLQARFFTR